MSDVAKDGCNISCTRMAKWVVLERAQEFAGDSAPKKLGTVLRRYSECLHGDALWHQDEDNGVCEEHEFEEYSVYSYNGEFVSAVLEWAMAEDMLRWKAGVPKRLARFLVD